MRPKNKFEYNGDFLIIDISTPSYPEARALLSISDIDIVLRNSAHRWYAFKTGAASKTLYAASNVRGKSPILLHQMIVVVPTGIHVDHRNGDGLDCRRTNLRAAIPGQNAANVPSRLNSTSRFKGVSFSTLKGKWLAQITANGQHHFLGWFLTEEDAARAYDRAAASKHKEFASLNFPLERNVNAA